MICAPVSVTQTAVGLSLTCMQSYVSLYTFIVEGLAHVHVHVDTCQHHATPATAAPAAAHAHKFKGLLPNNNVLATWSCVTRAVAVPVLYLGVRTGIGSEDWDWDWE